jgi:peptidoglycan/LPS O-acetylase OafA/YrhL
MSSPPAASLSARDRNSAALDQWRGAALFCVLISHGFFFTHRVDGIGRIGVNLFFFISGILVFRSLAGSARVGLPLALSFWKRRFLRLYPALVGYVAALALIVGLLSSLPGGSAHASLRTYLPSVPYALLFWTDFYSRNDPALGHLWSVSVEMQFYVLAPLVYFLGRYRSPGRLVIWLAVLLLLMAAVVVKVVHGYTEKYDLYEFQFAVWPMMLGFICESQKRWVALFPRAVITGAIGLGVVLMFLAMALAVLGMKKALVVALGATVFVPCLFSYADGRSLPGLPGRFFKWCGERTYSIYLWQEPLTLCDFLPHAFQPLGALAAIPIGAGWYRFLERPFLSGGRRRATEKENLLGSGSRRPPGDGR